jgi:hypothetical protein
MPHLNPLMPPSTEMGHGEPMTINAFSSSYTLTSPNSPFINCLSHNAEIFTRKIEATNGHGMSSLGPAIKFLYSSKMVIYLKNANDINIKIH